MRSLLQPARTDHSRAQPSHSVCSRFTERSPSNFQPAEKLEQQFKRAFAAANALCIAREHLHIISPLRPTMDIMRVRDGNLLQPYRSQSPGTALQHRFNMSGMCPARTRSYPTPPPFSLHPHETKDDRPIIGVLAPSNKGFARSQFSRLCGNKALTASTKGLHGEAATPSRILQGISTLDSL